MSHSEARILAASPIPGLKYWGMAEAVKYLAGEFDEQALTQVTGPSHNTQCAVQYACGLWMLASGNRQKAREHFTACINTGVCGWIEYSWSKAFLARMDQDPQWPEWIGMVPPRPHRPL